VRLYVQEIFRNEKYIRTSITDWILYLLTEYVNQQEEGVFLYPDSVFEDKFKGEKPIIENWQKITARIESAMQIAIIECLPDRQAGAGLQITPLGLHNP